MAALVAVLAQVGPYGNHMDGWDNGTSWWMVAMMGVVGIAVLAAVVWGAVAISRNGHAGVAAPTASTGPSPRDILDRRYANGEIDTADYEERKARLL